MAKPRHSTPRSRAEPRAKPPPAQRQKPNDEAAEAPSSPYVLRLYVTGSTPRSARAIETIKRLCDTHLAGEYDLRIVDLYQEPSAAAAAQILAAPTLVRQLPAPIRRLVGDMTDEQRVRIGLGLDGGHV